MWGVALYGFFFMLCCGTIECCFHNFFSIPTPPPDLFRLPPTRRPPPIQDQYRPNVDALAKAFEDHLFGQPMAHTIVLGAIYGHVTNPNPPKPLVLSLHGPTGTGKHHISRLVVENLYTNGMKSECVTIKMSTMDYPHHDKLDQYKVDLVKMIKYKVSTCPPHLFIFDEVDSMPAGLLDSIKTFLDYDDKVEGVNYRKAIFIFRSNLAKEAINKHMLESYEKGIARKDIRSVDMERIISNEISGNSDAGMYKARIIDSHIVSHFIPFFPLEASHVRQCIRAEFKGRGYASNSISEDEVLAELQFYGRTGSTVRFAVKGCKNVAEKVSVNCSRVEGMLHKKFGNHKTGYWWQELLRVISCLSAGCGRVLGNSNNLKTRPEYFNQQVTFYLVPESDALGVFQCPGTHFKYTTTFQHSKQVLLTFTIRTTDEKVLHRYFSVQEFVYCLP